MVTLTSSRPEALVRGRMYGATSEPQWFTPGQVSAFLRKEGKDHPAYQAGLTAEYRRDETNPHGPTTIEYALFERGLDDAWEEDQDRGPSLFSQYYLPL